MRAQPLGACGFVPIELEDVELNRFVGASPAIWHFQPFYIKEDAIEWSERATQPCQEIHSVINWDSVRSGILK